MKHLLPTAFALAAVSLLAACGGRSAPATETSVGEFETSVSADDGVQRMREYHFSDTLQAYGHTYSYTIQRVASDELPKVRDDEGTLYADNVYLLSVEREGQAFYSHRFVKDDFAASLSKDFREKALLDGMMCDKSLPGINFAVSVSLPQSDMIEPLLLHIYKDGSIAIEKDNRAE